jgi:hypothetical protein
MKKFITFLTLALSVVVLILFSTSTPIGATKTDSDYQRYITFHNDFDFPIYPVIQVPTNNCVVGDTSVRRILVNGPSNDGLQPNDTLTVLIPHTKDTNNGPTVTRCWYKSGRIYIFPVKLTTFEGNMVRVDKNNSDQVTTLDKPLLSVPCFMGKRDNYGKGTPGKCFTGRANNSFAADVPAQLAEYTFDSDGAASNGDPDTGIAMADIDVSNVDDFYLPIAASVVNNGATGYMGGARALLGGTMLSNAQQRINNFLSKNSWSIYAAYLANNQPSPPAINNAIDATQLPKQLVQGKNTPSPHLPGGFNLIQNSLSRAASSVYQFQNNAPGNYLLSGVTYNPNTRIPSNPLMQPQVDRWMWWVNQFNPDDFNPDDPNSPPLTCSQTVMGQFNPSDWPDGIGPKFDRQDFCNHYLTTVRDVWVHFLKNSTEGFNDHSLDFYKDCGLYDPNQPNIPPPTDPTGNLKNACIIQHIVGYVSGVLGGQLPGEVQALLRGVAYNPKDGLDPANKQYQYDPFLTFAAPYNSKFNLNPYTRLIHSPKDGIGAVSYSFSIDDKYGNFRDASVGILIDAGGTTILDNKQPYDPYQQYSMNWGYNRDKFTLLSVAPGVTLENVQDKLAAIAANNNNQPFLIKQDQNISVFGHAAVTGDTWKLTNPLVTLAQLQYAAQQEHDRTNGASTDYQTLINYLFGNSTIKNPISSIFPSYAWDGSSTNPTVGLLDFDAGGSGWDTGKAILYGNYISQQNADIPQKGNWVSADATKCGIPTPVTISGPGSQRLPVRLGQPCQVTLTDSFKENLVFQLTPVSKQVQDKYTGATVTVTSLPTGDQTSGDPATTSNLTANDLKFCTDNTTVGRMTGYCNNINVSAVWSADPLSRDVVYMGLDPTNMPRVNVNLPNAPPTAPDTSQVSWPTNAAITVQQRGTNVIVSWTPAVASEPVNYTVYQWNGSGWPPVCLNISATTCSFPGQAQGIYLYAIAVNANDSSKQSGNLCYPATNQCPPANPANLKGTRSPRR